MEGVFPVKRTKFLKFQLFLGIPAVFAGCVIPPLTFAALKGYQLYYLFFARHIPYLIKGKSFFPKIHGFRDAPGSMPLKYPVFIQKMEKTGKSDRFAAIIQAKLHYCPVKRSFSPRSELN